MRANKLIIVVIICMGIAGCASLVTKKPGEVVVLPEERIYTLLKGQEITMQYDGKPVTLAFGEDMKIVSSTVLVRQEMRLNEEALKSAKAKEDANKKLTLWGSIMAAISAALGVFVSMKKWKPSLNLSVK